MATDWQNYFVTTLSAFATEGHIPAEKLRSVITSHDGAEAYHCAFDLEVRDDFSHYVGRVRPALGFVWFDFDSDDGGEAALSDTRRFVLWLGVPDLFIAYSGSKGFHVGVPFSYFGMEADFELHRRLHRVATHLKKTTYPTLDTTIYNANRKFRALGSRHPKTGLYKIRLDILALSSSLSEIREVAKTRGELEIEEPVDAPPLTHLVALFHVEQLAASSPTSRDSISLEEWRRYRQPEGTAAFAQCGFLSWARDNPAAVNEPQWYACASVVGRFKDGPMKFQMMSRGHPDYDPTRTQEKLDQALQASGPRTCAAIDTLWDGCKNCPLYQKIKSPVVIMEKEVIPTEATGFYDLIQEQGKPLKRVPNYNDLLRRFTIDLPYKTIADMKTVYVFKETHYEEYTPIEIKGFAESHFVPPPQEKLRQEFTHKVFANSITRRSFFIETTTDRINFKNGVLCLETGSLHEHSSEFGFRGVLPYLFDPSAICPTFDWWIRDVMCGDEDLVRILQEFMGYVVRGGDYKYHKALWLSGTGRNGKSTFLSVLKALIGASNYSTLSIRQIINDKFSSADLDGKIANFSEETSPEELSDSGPFKNLTGDGELLAQKKYGDPYSFRNRAKLIMTYNEVPILKDLSPGMMSRPIIIPWKKDLTNEKTQDRNLGKKLLAELPGIFNFALAGWNRLEKQEGFTESAKTQLSLHDIQIASCSAFRWINEQVHFMPCESGKTYDARGLYAAYCAWYQEAGGQTMGEMKFLKRINTHPEMRARTRHVKKGKEYFALKLEQKSLEEVLF